MKSTSVNIYDVAFFARQCTGVLLGDRFVRPIFHELLDDPENEFLTLEWDEISDPDGRVSFVQVGFKEGDNENVSLQGSLLLLTDDTGEERALTLLQEWHPLVK